jgi:hypothetical protein
MSMASVAAGLQRSEGGALSCIPELSNMSNHGQLRAGSSFNCRMNRALLGASTHQTRAKSLSRYVSGGTPSMHASNAKLGLLFQSPRVHGTETTPQAKAAEDTAAASPAAAACANSQHPTNPSHKWRNTLLVEASPHH